MTADTRSLSDAAAGSSRIDWEGGAASCDCICRSASSACWRCAGGSWSSICCCAGVSCWAKESGARSNKRITAGSRSHNCTRPESRPDVLIFSLCNSDPKPSASQNIRRIVPVLSKSKRRNISTSYATGDRVGRRNSMRRLRYRRPARSPHRHRSLRKKRRGCARGRCWRCPAWSTSEC